MNRTRLLRLQCAVHGRPPAVLAAVLVLCAPHLHAQAAPDAGPGEPTASAPVSSETPALDCSRSADTDLHGYPAGCNVPTVAPKAGSQFVALNGSGVVPITGGGHKAVFGAGFLGGYDSAFAGSPNASATFTGQNGYAAVFLGRPGGYFVLQNSVDFVSYRVGNGTRQYFDNAGLTAGGELSSTWSWDANLTNAIGNDSLQVITPLNTVNQNNLAVPSPDTPAFAVQAGRVLDNDASFSLVQSISRRQSWRYLVHNSYREVFDQNLSDDTLHGRVEYAVQTSPAANWGIFSETAHETGTIRCTTETLGVSFERQVMRRSTLQLSGGPAVGSKGCVVTVTGNFFGAFTSQLSNTTALYASGSRNLNDSLVLGATWQDTVQGGISQRVGLGTQLRMDAGYLRGTQPKQIDNFHGTFVSGSVERALPGGFSLAFSLRRFTYGGANISLLGRTQVYATLGWSSARRSARTSDEVAIQ